MSRPPLLLCVLDGFGEAPSGKGNAIELAQPRFWWGLKEKWPWTTLQASGEDVGLPCGLMGNSEVGHLNIGAGRIVYQEITRIDKAIRDGEFQKNPALQNAIAHGRTAHAYLFCGTRGVGKTSMARIFARALNAKGQTQAAEIGDAIMRGEDIDVVEIDGASNRGIDDARDLIAGAGIAPARSAFKIYIIDEVHMLTVQAFNALLKTMEEPPAHVKFILCTTEPHKVPATIQSRCQRFDFRNIPATKIAGHLRDVLAKESIAADDAAVMQVARLANGSMRDGLSLLDRLVAGHRDAGHVMAQIAHDRLDIHRDDRLILDDQNLGTGLRLDLLQRFLDQGFDIGGVEADQIAGIFRGEAFERGQQQRLARQRGQPGQSGMGDRLLPDRTGEAGLVIQMRGRPDRMEGLVEAEARIDTAGKLLRRSDDRFERGADIGIAMSLAARQRARIAPQERKMGVQLLSKRHR